MVDCRHLLVVPLCIIAVAANAQVYVTPYVSANARVSASFSGGVADPLIVKTADTGELSVTPIAFIPAVANLTIDESRTDAFGNTSRIVNEAYFSASPGVLRANASSWVSLSGSSGPNPGAISDARSWTLASTLPGATFVDTINILGVPAGTPVTLMITAALEGFVSDTGVDSGSSSQNVVAQGGLSVSSSAGGGVEIIRNSIDGEDDAPFSLTDTFTTIVIAGSAFQIQASLVASAEAARGNYPGDSASQFQSTHTAYVAISSADPSVVVESASGYSYATVPEPRVMMLLGIAWLAIVAGRRLVNPRTLNAQT